MPVIPLMTALLERGFNRLLYRDPALRAARLRLRGKVLRISLREFALPLVLVFGERRLDVVGQWEGEVDCSLAIKTGVLPALRDRQQLAFLIKTGDVDVEGDIQVLQHFATLLDQADFDPAERLAPYTGDIVAEGVSRALRGVTGLFKAAVKRNQQYMAEAITEEWRLAPPPLEQAWFVEEVNALSREANELLQRLQKLEAK